MRTRCCDRGADATLVQVIREALRRCAVTPQVVPTLKRARHRDRGRKRARPVPPWRVLAPTWGARPRDLHDLSLPDRRG